MAFIDELKAKQRTDDIVKDIQEEFNRWFDSEVQKYVQAVVNRIKREIVARVEKGETGNISGEWDFGAGVRFCLTKELGEKIERYNVSLKLPEGMSKEYGLKLNCVWVKEGIKRWTETKGILFLKKTRTQVEFFCSLTEIAKKILVSVKNLATQEGIKLDGNNIQCNYQYFEDREKFVLQGVDSSHKTRGVMGVENFKILIPYSIEL